MFPKLEIAIAALFLLGPPSIASAQGLAVDDRARLLPTLMTAASPARPLALTSQSGDCTSEGTTCLTWARLRHPDGGAGAIRIRVEVGETGDTSGWSVRVLRGDGTGSPSLDLEGSENLLGSIHWSTRISGATARIELRKVSSDIDAPMIVVDRYAFEARGGLDQAVVGQNDLRAIFRAGSTWRAMGRSVARLRIMVDGIGEAQCTGFLVAERLLMTNHHCVATREEAQATIAEFDVERESSRAIQIPVLDLVANSEALDYSVLELPAWNQEAGSGRGALRLHSQKPLPDGRKLGVIQHPSGEAQQISTVDCLVDDAELAGVSSNLSDFAHACDTRDGSSGSPMIERNVEATGLAGIAGAVVGLHHLGFPPGSEDAKALNRAVYITDILADLEARYPEVVARLPPDS